VKIEAWLTRLGLHQYAQAFRENHIDTDVLPRLTAEDLIALGVTSVGHRRRLLDAIAEIAVPNAPKGTVPASDVPPLRSTSPSIRAERRQLTVMFVDLVGSTVLTTRLDPEEMSDLIRAYQNAVVGEIARFEGHVAQFVGDGIVVYFGWPRAHEDEAERAVRAGLGIAGAVSKVDTAAKEPLRVRIGIATGLVVVGDLVGEGAAREEMVVGETPNLAARLQAVAEGGTVVVSDATRRLLGALFELVDLGPLELKGFAAPVRAWQVVGESRAESRFEAMHDLRLSPLVDRKQELALLLERWRRAKAGEGQVVLLSGEPGIGKSRMVLALRERLHDDDRVSVRYHGSPYHTNTALFPIVEQLERASGFGRGDPPELKLAGLESLLGQTVADPRVATCLIAEHLAIPTDDRFPSLDMAAEEKRAEIFRALVASIEGFAAKQPLLMTAEDVHWFDPTSLEVLESIIDRIERLPVFLIITFRPEFAPRWPGRPHITLLTLNRLARSDGEVLVEHLAGGKELPAEVQTHILTKTEGVPLFVEEMTKAVLESSLLRDAGERYELTRETTSLAIPSTLQASLLARLDRLASVKQVAQVAASIGREFSFDLLAAVADLAEDDLRAALDQLVESGLVFRRSTPPEATYSFKHALVQDAAYQSLLKSRRQRLHAQIAAVLDERSPKAAETEPELLARHYSEAGMAEPAIRYWLRAAQLASRRSAHRETIVHCQRALSLIAQLPDRPERDQLELELRIVLGPAIMVAKGFAGHEVSEVYQRARELCRKVGQPTQLFVVLYGLWIGLIRQTRLEPARDLAKEILVLAQGQPDAALVLQAHHANWTTYLHLSDIRSSLEHARKGIELYDADKHRHHAFVYGGHDPGVCCRNSAAECLWLMGYHDQALENANEAVKLARQLSHPFSEVQALFYLAQMRRWRREVDPTRQLAEAAITLCADHGIGHHYIPMGKVFRGWALALAGDVHEGIGQICQGIEEYCATGPMRERPHMHILLADACAQVGRTEQGLAAVVEGLASAEENGGRVWVPELLCLKGRLLLAGSAQDAGNAQSCFEHAIDLARGLYAKILELRAATSLAQLWAERRERQQARSLLTPIYSWFTEGFDTPDLKNAKALLDELA
jgi:class 3 adenylate cyclase/tetratricopeptide (TPR) repeat protein